MKILAKIKKRPLILSILFALLLIGIVYAAEYYQVNSGAQVTINEWSVCKKVTNNNALAIFVPTKTAEEWTAFRTYASGVSYAVCCSADGATCSVAGDCCSGYCTDGVCCNGSCTGNCNRCNVAGSIGTCTDVASDCTGNCDVCSSGNCAASSSLCTGNCDTCVGAGTAYSCFASNALCSNTAASCYCSGSGTVFNCQACATCKNCSSYSCVNVTTACNAGTYGCTGTTNKCYNGACVGAANGVACSVADQCCSGYCYVDADGDRYAPASGTKTCRASSQLTGTDCCDSDSRAYPGETTYYSTINNCSSWDYDCSGVQNKSPTSYTGCCTGCTKSSSCVGYGCGTSSWYITVSGCVTLSACGNICNRCTVTYYNASACTQASVTLYTNQTNTYTYCADAIHRGITWSGLTLYGTIVCK